MSNNEQTTENRQDVERCIMSGIFFDPSQSLSIAINAGVTSDWFEDQIRSSIFKYCMTKYAKGVPPNEHVVFSHFEDADTREEIDKCDGQLITIAFFASYIEALRLYHQRDVMAEKVDSQLMLMSQASPSETDELLDKFREEWQSVNTGITTTREMWEIADEKIIEWQTPISNREQRVVYATPTMDRLIGTLTNELVYISASESVGKTAMVVQMLIRNGEFNNQGAFASLESSVERIVPRIITHIAGVNTLELEQGHYDEQAIIKVKHARDRIKAGLGFSIIDRPMTIEQIHAWGKLQKAKGAKYLVVDNTRHIKLLKQMKSRVDEMSYKSIRLKEIRDDLQIPIIAIHHSNKDGDVSWSQDLRRDVDVLLLLSNDEEMCVEPSYENEWKGEWWVGCMVDKNRDGRKGFSIKLRYDKETQTFIDN